MVLHCSLLLRLHLLQFILLVGDFLRHLALADADVRTSLVKGVDGLVGELSVRDISLGERHASLQSLVGVSHMVVMLISATYISEDLQCLLLCGRFHENLLESTFQSPVFLNAVAVFVQRGGTDTLNNSPGEGRLHDIGGIHGAWSASGSHESVNLVDKYNNVGIGFQLLEQRLQAFLKLSAVFCSCHNGCHVEIDNALVVEQRRGLLVGYHLSQTFHYGTLADSRFTYEHGVVLLSPAQYLHYSQNLPFASHHRVERTTCGSFGEVGAEVVYHWSCAVGLVVFHGCAAIAAVVA